MTNTRDFDHITPILKNVHWLSVSQHINLKILLTGYKSNNHVVSAYLCELVSIAKSSRNLTSSSQILLQMPGSRLKSYGYCEFMVAAPISVIRPHLFKLVEFLIEFFRDILRYHCTAPFNGFC